MATLENIQGSSLVADPSQALNLLLQSFGTQGQREAKAEQQRLTGVIADPGSPQERQSALIELTSMNAPLGQAVQGILESGDKRQARALLQQKEKGTRNALLVKGAKSLDGKRLRLNEWLKRIAIEPDSPEKAKRMQRVSDLKNLNEDQLNVELQRIENAGKSIDVILKEQAIEVQAEKEQDARFSNRMLALSDEQQFPELIALEQNAISNGDTDKANSIRQIRNTPFAQRQTIFRDIAGQVPAVKPVSLAAGARLVSPTGQTIVGAEAGAGGVEFAKPAVKDFTPESVQAANAQGGSVSDLKLRPESLAKLGGSDAFKIGREVKIRVGDNEFFVTPVTQRDKDGNVVTVGNLTPIVGPEKGKPVDFISPLGETGGQETARKVGEGTELAQRKQSLVISKEAFDKIQPIDNAILNIDKGIAAIDEGANTGPAISSLPSITQASVTLDNVQAQMGLDVIGNTTFGALSESELNFALSSALPKSLRPDALKKWLQDKKAAQTKLRDYLRGAASFFSQGGTIKEFNDSQIALEKLRNSQDQVAPAPGQVGRFKVRIK